MTQERFVYFYTTPPFWAAAGKPAFYSLMPSDVERLPEQMSVLVLEREIAGTQIRIYYDGLIELRRTDLDAEIYPPSGIIRDNTKVSDAGLLRLQRFGKLQELALTNSKVTDEGVKKLQQAIPNCEIHY